MAAQDDLSDIIPGGANASSSPANSPVGATGVQLSPWLIMQAQKEAASGQPGIATAQLGAQALKAQHPAAIAGAHQAIARPAPYVPRPAGFMGPPAPQPSPATPSPVNPAGVAGSTQGDPSQGQGGSPTLQQIAEKVRLAGQAQGVPQTADQAKLMPKGVTMSDKVDDTSKAQLSTVQKMPYTPQALQITQDAVRGISHPIVGYNKVTDPNGKVVDNPNSPIYDMDPAKATYAASGKPVAPEDMTSPYQEQRTALQKLQALLNAKRQMSDAQEPRPTDLSGLMMAADFLNHTDAFSRNYENQRKGMEGARQDQQRETQQDYQDQNEIQKGQNDLNKDTIQQSTAMLNGGTQAQLLANQQALMAQQGYNGNPKGAADSTAQNRFFTKVIQLTKPLMDEEEAADKVTQLVNSHNPGALPGIKEALTRMMTGARPQMQMIAQQAQDPSLGQRMETWFSLAENGQLPVENVAQMNQMVSDINKVTGGRRAQVVSILHGFGDSLPNLDRPTQDSMIPGRANPGLPAVATAGGTQSAKVAAGKAGAPAANAQQNQVKQTALANTMVRVVGPDGKGGSIPAGPNNANLKAFLADPAHKGWKQVTK